MDDNQPKKCSCEWETGYKYHPPFRKPSKDCPIHGKVGAKKKEPTCTCDLAHIRPECPIHSQPSKEPKGEADYFLRAESKTCDKCLFRNFLDSKYCSHCGRKFARKKTTPTSPSREAPHELEAYDSLDEIGQSMWLMLGHFWGLGKDGKEWKDIYPLVAEKREHLQRGISRKQKDLLESLGAGDSRYADHLVGLNARFKLKELNED